MVNHMIDAHSYFFLSVWPSVVPTWLIFFIYFLFKIISFKGLDPWTVSSFSEQQTCRLLCNFINHTLSFFWNRKSELGGGVRLIWNLMESEGQAAGRSAAWKMPLFISVFLVMRLWTAFCSGALRFLMMPARSQHLCLSHSFKQTQMWIFAREAAVVTSSGLVRAENSFLFKSRPGGQSCRHVSKHIR